MAWSEISVKEAAGLLSSGHPLRLVDVREHEEYAICHIDGSEHMPLSGFRGDGSELAGPTSDLVLVLCHHGVRSLHAARYFDQLGYEDVRSIAGGINRWAIEVDPEIPRY